MASTTEHQAAEAIAGGMRTWLRQEMLRSERNSNAYLSEFEGRRADLYEKSFDDSTNLLANKTQSHRTRIRNLILPYADADKFTSDAYTGRLIYHCLEQISGSYRYHCLVASPTPEEHWQRRHHGEPASVDLLAIAEAELAASQSQPDTNVDQRVQEVIGRTLRVDNEAYLLLRAVPEVVQAQRPNPERDPLKMTERAQELWAGLSVAHILVAAAVRANDLPRVPCLAPLPFGEVSFDPIYPFVSAQ